MEAEQAREIFKRCIVPSIGAKGESPEHPTLIVVAGQPGSGKSTAIRQAEMGLNGATQKIIGDDFEAWVPGYYDLASKSPQDAVRCARAAGSGHFIQETVKRAETMRANVIQECAVPTSSAPIAALYREQGYRTELHIVATPHYQSWTGVLDRAERALSNGHIGTNVLVPRDAHDQTYSGWARAVFDAEHQMQYDRIVITRRDGSVMYKNDLVKQNGGVRWANPAKGMETLFRERHRAVSDADATRAKEAWQRIVQNGPMESHVGLRDLPLEAYRNEIINFLRSEASRVTPREPSEFSPSAVIQWRTRIMKDLAFARSSRNQFGYSEEFDRRTHEYGAAITSVAGQYPRSRPVTRLQTLASQKRTGIRNFSLPMGTERSSVRFDPTGTGASLVSGKSQARLNNARPAIPKQSTKEKVRSAIRSLKHKSKEFLAKPFGLLQAQRGAPTTREATKSNWGQVKDQGTAEQMSQGQDGHEEIIAAPKIAKDRGFGTSSQERQDVLPRVLNPRDRCGRSR